MMKRTTIVGLGLVLLATAAPLRAAVTDYTWVTDGLAVSGSTITASGGTGHAVAEGTSDSDYSVIATCVMPEGAFTQVFCGPEARQDGAAPDVFTMRAYALFLMGPNNRELVLHRLGAGTSERIIDSASFEWVSGVEYLLTLTVEGTTISGCVAGGPCLSGTDSTLSSGTAGVGMRRTVTENPAPEIVDFEFSGEVVPPPPSGTFIDDDDNVHEGMIEAIAALGITQGCSAEFPLFYCPFNPVTRAQMASFIVRALDLPASGTDWFDDDDGDVHEPNINALAEADITFGCGPATSFCPDDLVTRAQMASFLARAFDLPASGTDWFDDDDGDVHEPNINALAEAAITLGCDPGDASLFCPTDSVQRDQMASFLGRALGLDPIEPS